MKTIHLALMLVLLSAAGLGQEIRRPSSDVDNPITGCVNADNTNDVSQSMPNAYDAGGLSTSSALSVTGASSNLHATERQFSGFSAASGLYTALSLNVNFSCTDSANFDGNCRVLYSTNGGSTYTAAFTSSIGVNVAQQTTTVTLSNGQDLTQMRVRVCGEDSNINATPATETVTVWDIWTSGTLAGCKSCFMPFFRLVDDDYVDDEDFFYPW